MVTTMQFLFANLSRTAADITLAKDSFALRKHIKENTPDIDLTFDFKCNDPENKNCNLERRVDVPMGASFLWLDADA